MRTNQQIGGDYTCQKCGESCTMAIFHDCPKDKLPLEQLLIENKIDEITKEISRKEDEIEERKQTRALLKNILRVYTENTGSGNK